jgi:hypothetical protein
MVYIIGFTKNVFKKELFSRPEFGIVTTAEVNRLTDLKNKIIKENLESDIQMLKELKIRLSQRLRSRRGNGFFEFIGYRELVNKLLIKKNLDSDIQINDIKTEEELEYYIQQNILKLNVPFLEQFNKSLIICDEIHNVYNSLETNNWGLCLQIIFRYFNKLNTLRVLLLSATPINNNPIEIVSLLNLLNSNIVIKKEEIFDKNNNIIIKNNNKQSGYDIIKKYIIGRISYIKDLDIEAYPSKEIYGETIPEISFLKFIRCPMSDLHFKTYLDVSKRNEEMLEENTVSINKEKGKKKLDLDILEDEIIYSTSFINIKSLLEKFNSININLELNNRYLNDIVFPNPDDNKIGIYKKEELIHKLKNSNQEWKEKYEIDLIKNDKIMKNTVTGNFLLEDNIKKYSTKYFEMLKIIRNIINNDLGKILIYHNFVQVSGINLISEILRINGFLDINELPTKLSRCNICYKFKYMHDESNSELNHDFAPIRFIMVSSLYTKNIIDKQLDIFNLNINANGKEIRIIIGSRAIKESYDLKAVQNLILLHQPDNISNLIQIFGRSIRKNSHIELPPSKRKVNIYILVSSIPNYYKGITSNTKNSNKISNKGYLYSYEEMKYKYKIDIYKIIQNINNIFIENAVDLNINYNINFPPANKISDTNNPNDLYYIKDIDKSKMTKVNYNNINLSTFSAYYYEDEINTCKYLIKRFFIEYSKVWTYDDLLKNIRMPYFKINFNTSLISEYSFIIALDFLVMKKNNLNVIHENIKYAKTNISNLDTSQSNINISELLISNLFNNNEKIIIDSNGNYNIIMFINKYYILVPYDEMNNYVNIFDKIVMNNDILYREYEIQTEKKISLNEILKKEINIDNYDMIKKYFIKKYQDIPIDNILEIIYEFEFKFHLEFIEELIAYFFNLYTDSNVIKHIYHDFYLKLLYFYNKLNIIIFANKLDNELEEIYGKYVISTKIMTFTISDSKQDNYNYNNLIYNLENEYELEKINTPKIYFSFYNKVINESNNYLKVKNKSKVYDYLLPIGHIFDKKFKFYHPSKYWFTKLLYNNINIKYEDNDLIIGYLEKTNIGFDIIFKLRKPNYKKNIKDQRQIESGINCAFKDKDELIKLCRQLNINIKQMKLRKNTLCEVIKIELIKRELNERKKNSKIKYFYFYWE